MYSIGIDIGTSSISAVISDKDKNIIDIASVKNDSKITAQYFESLQDPYTMSTHVNALVITLLQNNSTIKIEGIGVSNQMHGILYVDKKGNALSPLYNWQDKRADELCNGKEKKSYSDIIFEKTSFRIPTGYGIATHYYNQCCELIPNDTYCILDIGSFVISQLTKTFLFTIHPSNAQSWGLFDNITNKFDIEALKKLQIPRHILPRIEEQENPVGFFDDIPIFESIGDNQAGVLGTMGSSLSSIALNIGTSSQISFLNDEVITHKHTREYFEERPFIGNKKLYVACGLSGGKSIDIWVYFLSSIVKAFVKDVSETEIVNNIYNYLSQITEIDSSVKVKPYFYASRNNPNLFASIEQLCENNFNLKNISIALIEGIVDELFNFWEQVPLEIKNKKTALYFTGGAIKIPLVNLYIEKKFACLTKNNTTQEQNTALGAALWSIHKLLNPL